MITNIELISDAYRMLGVIDENETPSAEQGVLALRVLNQMMAELEEREINIQYFEQTDQDADFPCAKYTHSGVTATLAMRLAGHFGIEPSALILDQAASGYNVILRKSIVKFLPEASMVHLPQGEAQDRGDIINGDV